MHGLLIMKSDGDCPFCSKQNSHSVEGSKAVVLGCFFRGGFMCFHSNKYCLATNPGFYFLGKKAKVLKQAKNIVRLE